MSLLRRRMMMAKKPDVPDAPTEEWDYLTIIPLHEEEVEYRIYPLGGVNAFGDPYIYEQDLPFYYRINKGEWIEVNLQPSEDLVFVITLTNSQELQLKCMGCNFSWDYSLDMQTFHIYSKGAYNVSGTPMSLLYGDGFKENNYAIGELLINLFANNIGLTQILNPKTFLPYTELGVYCYCNMFFGCAKLTNSPELPAKTLVGECYMGMFSGCININYIKMLATDISAYDCLYYWVKGVASTGTFVANKDATWDTTPGALGSSGVPAGWTVITDGQEGGSVGKTINKITATISEDWGEVTATLSSLYPVASDVFGYLVTNAGSAFFIFDTGKSSINCYQIGTFQEIYLDTTEDDTYIYELEVII